MIPDRIAKKIGPPTESGCWPWTAARGPAGYGVVYMGERNHQAHRAVYILTVGPIPDGMQLDHLCFNSSCVNPAHMEVVTPAENKRRIRVHTNGYQKKTHCPQGHPYEGVNLYVRPQGGRGCVTCRADAVRRYESDKVRTRTPHGRIRIAVGAR